MRTQLGMVFYYYKFNMLFFCLFNFPYDYVFINIYPLMFVNFICQSSK